MCQTEMTRVTEEEGAAVECRACAMIAGKMRGRRPKHAEGCGYVPEEKEEKPKPKSKSKSKKSKEASAESDEMKEHPRMSKEMQKMIKDGVKEWQKAKKSHKKVKSEYHKELKKVVKKVAAEKVKVVKVKKSTKPKKLVRLSYCSSMADKACQVNLNVNGVEIPVFEVEVC